MSLSPEREAEEQEKRLHAAGQMTPKEIVTLQDDLAWWKAHAASLSVILNNIAKETIERGMKGTT